jgi:heavy metal translocating P-type ATPase
MPPALERSACLHCAEILLPDQSGFCCAGCEAVYRLLHARGLQKFYDLREGRPGPKPIPVSGGASRPYAAWDLPTFRQTYAPQNVFKAHLSGIHCLGCLWLVENLSTQVPGLNWARLDLGRSVATFALTPELSLEKLAMELVAFGYRPTPLADAESESTLARALSRREISRLGVAALSASNIMLSSIPLYSGISESMAPLFLSLSALLYVPVLTYAAIPFYENSLQKLMRRSLSIDLPIAVALIGGGIYSYWNFFRGTDEVYFDSLAAITFLLLAVRLLLRHAQSGALAGAANSLETTSVQRVQPDGLKSFATVASLSVGDQIEVFQDQILPTDGIVRSARSEWDLSILTGEAFPQLALFGEAVYAGAALRAPSAIVEVTAKGVDSRLGCVIAQTQVISALGTRWATLSDKVGRAFVASVFALIAVVLALNVGGSWHETIRRVLAISVVSCPCAFAFAVPLTFVLALKRLARLGIIVSNPLALEKLALLKQVLLDKTGTLTQGRLKVVRWCWLEEEANTRNAVYSLERKSRHPIARALVQDLQGAQEISVSDFVENIGLGVEGRVGGRFYSVRAAQQSPAVGLSRVEVWTQSADGQTLLATADLQDVLRSDSQSAVAQLRRLGLEPWLLSGDSEGVVSEVAAAVGIPLAQAQSRMTPQAKGLFVRQHPLSMMVGDGANDSIALAQADVGVAVSGGVEWSLKAADVYLTQPGVMPLVHLVRFGRRMRAVILANLVVSVAFNATAISLAATGRLSPLFAAVFMPVSSFSVFCITWLGMRKSKC